MLFLYNVADLSSFEAIPELVRKIQDLAGQEFLGVLIGLSDSEPGVPGDRVITELEGFKLSAQLGLDFCEMSFASRVTFLYEFDRIIDRLWVGHFGQRNTIEPSERSVSLDSVERKVASVRPSRSFFARFCSIF